MKIIASIKKGEAVRFISHLDVQRNLQRTIRRADIPVAYSQGFNPHPLISFATALSVGQTGDGEWIEIRLEKSMQVSEFIRRMNENFPQGLQITHAFTAADGMPSLSTLMEAAEYTVSTDSDLSKDALLAAINELLSGEIIVRKTKKQNGRKIKEAEIDIRPMIYEFNIINTEAGDIKLHVLGRLDASGGLNCELLLKTLNEKLKLDVNWSICRSNVKLSINTL